MKTTLIKDKELIANEICDKLNLSSSHVKNFDFFFTPTIDALKSLSLVVVDAQLFKQHKLFNKE